MQAGAGIVADSVPEHEDLECHNKARALLAAVPAARRMTAAPAGPVRPPVASTMAVPRSARPRSVADVPWATSCVVDGPDAVDYLQGQLSQDVDALAVGGTAWSFLLQPTGKVDAWLRGSPGSPTTRFLLDVDAGLGDGRAGPARAVQAAHQGRPRRRSTWAALRAVRGPAAPRGAGRRRGASCWPRVARRRRRRPPRPPTAPAASARARPAACEALRIARGVPACGADLDDDTIPAEAGRGSIEASVSFTKGCYTGQELVARIDSRGGNVPRPLRGLVVDGEPPPSARRHADGAEVGTVTSVARSTARRRDRARRRSPGRSSRGDRRGATDGGVGRATVGSCPLR